jgi:hypothetical protein
MGACVESRTTTTAPKRRFIGAAPPPRTPLPSVTRTPPPHHLPRRIHMSTAMSAPAFTSKEKLAGVLRRSACCLVPTGARLQLQRDASCRMGGNVEAMLSRDGVLTRALNRLSNPVSRPDAAEGGTRVRPACPWSCACVRVPWIRAGGAVVQTLSGCRSILRLAGTAVHAGLSPVATQVSGRSPVWLSRARRGALSGGWIAVSVDNVRSLVCGFERRRCTPPGTWRRSKCWYSSARSWMREECSWRLSSPGQRPLRSASGSAGVAGAGTPSRTQK